MSIAKAIKAYGRGVVLAWTRASLHLVCQVTITSLWSRMLSISACCTEVLEILASCPISPPGCLWSKIPTKNHYFMCKSCVYLQVTFQSKSYITRYIYPAPEILTLCPGPKLWKATWNYSPKHVNTLGKRLWSELMEIVVWKPSKVIEEKRRERKSGKHFHSTIAKVLLVANSQIQLVNKANELMLQLIYTVKAFY